MQTQRQAKAPDTQPFGAEAFAASEDTVLRWLGMAGFLINSRGTTLMIDPLLDGFDMPLLIEMPHRRRSRAAPGRGPGHPQRQRPLQRPDLPGPGRGHRRVPLHPLRRLADGPSTGCPAHGHDIGEAFTVGPVRVELTPADHAWQNVSPRPATRTFQPEDACGFWIDTPDGTIWAPGDSRLIPDHHLTMPAPDALLFDFSDSDWHFGLAGAVQMANAYPDTPLLLHHWGSVDAPDFSPFNGDPETLVELVTTRPGSRFWPPASPSPWNARRRRSTRHRSVNRRDRLALDRRTELAES